MNRKMFPGIYFHLQTQADRRRDFGIKTVNDLGPIPSRLYGWLTQKPQCSLQTLNGFFDRLSTYLNQIYIFGIPWLGL